MKEIINNIKDNALFSGISGEELEELLKHLQEQNEQTGPAFKMTDDPRITKVGKFIRKTSLDELPQLFNVLKGEMSLVGPRPEVPKYVELYTEEQREILKVSAGITDYASIYFSNESELLGEAENPEEFYIKKIMPYKIELNKKYIKEIGIVTDIKLIILTILKILGLVKLEPKEL